MYFLRKGRGLGGKRTDADRERTGKIWLRGGLGCGMIWEMENNGKKGEGIRITYLEVPI